MPQHCCVPQCTLKGYRSSTGEKISYFNFPKSEELQKKWIIAIRRDPGTEFVLKDKTKVCSRHFRPTELKKSLTGIVTLKKGSVPSKFVWLNESPRKRKAPKDRLSPNSNARLQANADTDEHTDPCEIEEPKSVEDLLREEIDELKAMNCALKEKVIVLEADLSQKNAECKGLEHKYRNVYFENKTTKQERIEREKEVQQLQEELESLQSTIFTLDRFNSNENISFYTGFSNLETFMAIFKFLNTGEKGENIRYCSNKRDVPDEFYNCINEGGEDDEEQEVNSGSKKGRPRKLMPIDQFFMVMCRLRRGFAEHHLAHLFGVSQSTVSRVFISWINYMFLKFGQINIWPSKDVVLKTMPEAFKESFPTTRIIIDCTEIRCEMPSSLLVNTELFSSYKNHQTFKALVGIAPSGAITFISELYTGNISDREIVIRSGLLKQGFESGDTVMADKGFTIDDILPLGVSLNLPPFLGGNSQMSAEEVVATQTIASVRIHIERAINKIKNFRIWQGDFPLSSIGVANLMWGVCAFLCNAQDPLISA